MSSGQRNFKPAHRTKNKTHRTLDLIRDKRQKLYTSTEWKRYRARFLSINTRCYACGEYSRVVDHLFPHKGNTELFEKTDNHLPLCESCHNTVTAKFDRKGKSDELVEGKIKWLNDRRTMQHDPKAVKVLSNYRED